MPSDRGQVTYFSIKLGQTTGAVVRFLITFAEAENLPILESDQYLAVTVDCYAPGDRR